MYNTVQTRKCNALITVCLTPGRQYQISGVRPPNGDTSRPAKGQGGVETTRSPHPVETNRDRPRPQQTMADHTIIKHPLEECVSDGNLSDLDPQGRTSLDLILTLIGDLRFRRDQIEGTCARYFLLVDSSVVQNLCASAHIDCDKLRDHVRRLECGDANESGVILDDLQSSFAFLAGNGLSSSAQASLLDAQLKSDSDMERARFSANRDAATDAEKEARELQIQNVRNGPATPRRFAPLMKSEGRGLRQIERESKRG